MDRYFNVTEDQLDFISFMKEMASSRPEVKIRIDARINLLSSINESGSAKAQIRMQKHSPRKMIEFLSLFSRDEHFKWYTHRWDQAGVCLKDMIQVQKSIKGQLSKMVYSTSVPINEQTFYQVWNFINFSADPDKNYWTDNHGEHHKIGWHSIVDLSKQNSTTPIENLKLDDGRLFKDYIRLFKSTIEFRTDLEENDRFSEFVRSTVRKYINGAVSVKYHGDFDDIGYDINMYCDVVALHFALKTICNWIVRHKADGAAVNIELSSDKDGYELVIFHKGSYFNNIQKLENPSGDLAALRNRLFSVCDLRMMGDYKISRQDAGSINVDILDSDTQKYGKDFHPCGIDRNEDLIGGVKYVLKLYKQ